MVSTLPDSADVGNEAELTVREQQELQLIVERAKECGWLDQTFEVTAVVKDTEVEVIVTSSHRHITKWAYLRTDGWLFEFLRDVASEGIASGSPLKPNLL